MPKAIKIIDIDSSCDSFALDEKALKTVLNRVPKDLNVCVISVVGAFRTGKSFMLDLFLRYLRSHSESLENVAGEPDESWMFSDGVLEGNVNSSNDSSKEGGFSWRSGHDRCTTGIWIWEEYFIRTLPGPQGEKVAVLVMDTQGMFDSTLGQHLTASIFGISTLISSYSIYNLDKRVQEDNLQHLALFSEYGRVALAENMKRSLSDEWTPIAEDSSADSPLDDSRPFQRLELLVRDWQHFSDDSGPLNAIHTDMQAYLDEVLAERRQKDLKEVRDQIKLCFDSVSCWLLPHPGFEVIKKNYDGDMKKVTPEFRRLASDYIRRVFSERLVVKSIHGKPVTAMELFNFSKSYCDLFREAKIFPEATTLLAATAQANNMNAFQKALECYRSEMDDMVGAGKAHIKEGRLKRHHISSAAKATTIFKDIATIGPAVNIAQHRDKLESEIEDRFRDYVEANHLRDPFAFIAPYMVPFLVAVACYFLRYSFDAVCPRRSTLCLDLSDFFAAIFFTIVSFIFFHLLARGHGIHQRFKALFKVNEDE